MDYGYTDFCIGTFHITSNIAKSGIIPDFIVGISRGGAIPAVVLSHRLNIPCIMINWNTRETYKQNDDLHNVEQLLQEGKQILLVDDIVDSGETFRQIINKWNAQSNFKFKREKVQLCALIWNQSQDIICDYYHVSIDRTKEKDWVNFWWEV